jgi:hypothetical protein
LRKIRATFSDIQQSSQTLVQKYFNPIRTLKDDYLLFTDDKLKGVPDQTTFDITTPTWLTADMGLQLTMLAGSAAVPNRVTFTFYFGLQMKDSVMFSNMMNLYNASAKQVGPNGNVSGVSKDVQYLSNSPIRLLL